ncbi:2-dehydropantoate 2-reductase [Caminibacter mediatlanticus TB-2]|uniref:2-dehydropantoate 2-reductase n=1 Tax=Caminibacter mediatlanticus TB-2 TaxID=391592 RepID=A0ABX5V9Q8_9BACT|nr:2-dehydropantoate 2-reductase [Caminibacter mediatlanticus]QCT95023.1 2-dehydropantoate 2-reductase [Caminibacter mediatlanticus TB-2]
MRVLVVGVGGVGGYLAYKLIKCGVDVTIKARGEHLKAIKENGLKIIDVDKEDIVYPKTKIEGIYDIVFVTTKSYHLDDVIKEIKSYINENTRVVPILNGIGHFEKFKNLDAKILKACIYILSNIEKVGVIYKKTPLFYLCIEDDEKVKEIFKNCNDLKIKFSREIEKDIWKKYLFISTFATLQSYYQKPTGWIMQEKRDEVEKFLDEVIKIAKKEGIDLKEEKERVIKQALNIPYNSKMSMQIDFEKGNKTEVDNLTGYLAKKSEFINFYYKKLKNSLKSS